MKTEDIDYQDGNINMRGYAAYDDSKPGKRPGVLVVHEAWGLGEHVMERAKMLANMGYVALCADIYGDRKQISTMEEVMAVAGDLRANPQKLRSRARAAVAALASHPQVDSSRLGGIGFCFGGTTVLELARDGVDLRGVVAFHGGLETQAPAQPGAVKTSVLVCTGADDPMIPATQVNAFEEEMRKAKADWQVISYGGTVHSFTNPKADGSIAPGILYNESADRRSWSAMTAFFKEVFV